jgi:hypothetical protein
VYITKIFSHKSVDKEKLINKSNQISWSNLKKEFNSLNALNVTKTSRLRYASHMIRRLEDLPQKALFKAKHNGRRNQERLKSRWADGVNSDNLSLGIRDWIGRTVLKTKVTQIVVVNFTPIFV